MSYILEALNKSQREYARGRVPTLQGQAPSPRPSARRIGPLLASLLLGAFLTLFIAGYLFRSQASGPETSAQPIASAGRGQLGASQPRSAKLPVKSTESAQNLPRRQEIQLDPDVSPEVKAARSGTVQPETAPRTNSPGIPAKAWGELPADVRAAIGNLVLNIHVYSERPENRFVFINEREYGEGDVLTEGPTLEAINPTGLVLAFRGERFRLDM